MREVLSLTYELVITLVILIGGGSLLYLFKGTTSFEAILALVAATISAITTFWFSRRNAEQLMAAQDKNSQNNANNASNQNTTPGV